MRSLSIENIDTKPLDVPLTDTFTISQGSVHTVKNLLVTTTLHDGTKGYGEITPFPELAGETREDCIEKFNNIREGLFGQSLENIRFISDFLMEALSTSPSVRCGIEISLLDALTRALGIPLWAYFGGLNKERLKTDITIPILSTERSLELAEKWYQKDFRTLKIKVGANHDKEIELITEINHRHKGLQFIIDANQAFEENQALEFIRELLGKKCGIILLEQPLNRYDFVGMGRLKKMLNVPIAADESVFSIEDFRNVIHYNSADVVNIKIMKTGVFNALKIATSALSMGLELMIGGMVETRIAMGCSASIAMGYCPIKYIDLDTPLLMSSDPLIGGYSYCGPEIMPWENPGLGMEPIL
jgi:L-alanine-DL-glutamate epimerase-like enolase superfamily enzyme